MTRSQHRRRRTPAIATAVASVLWVSMLLAPPSLPALEVERGDLRLVLHEDSSRFSLYLLQDSSWTPLFVAEDPRTSGIEVLEGNTVYRIGDAGTFAQRVEATADGARFVWTSPTLEIVQGFRFTMGARSERFDAVEMQITLTNRGEEPSRVGLRVLLDTYLGERENTHFITPGVDQINREARLEPGPANAWVASVTSPQAGFGFQYQLTGDDITRPEAAVLANWKRLTDSSWDYEVNETRNFNRLPYSINDSALLVVYAAAQLEGGQVYPVVARMGGLSPEGYLAPTLAAQGSDTDLLRRLADIVVRLNELIAADTIDVDEVRELQAELQALTILVRGE